MSVTSKLDSIDKHFKLPIYYNSNKMEIKDNIISDLELINTIDASNNAIYSYYFNTIDRGNPLSEKIIKIASKEYTPDTCFLKDNQKFLKTFKPIENQSSDPSYKEIIESWDEIKCDTGFKERYYYIDWPMWEFLNNYQPFLQFMSIYNMTSPVISLFVPIIILVIPFFIIRLKKYI